MGCLDGYDPPYNTGNDFIYPDNYSESLQTYLEYTGQAGEEGKRFSSNTDTDGRFHSKWLNMMYPRLYLARDLLRDDGVIFISIDDVELQNLRRLLDEIFGVDNFISVIVWKNVTDNNPTNVAIEHEYVLLFCKDKNKLESVWQSGLSDVKQLLIDIGNRLNKKYADLSLLREEYTKWFRENKRYLGPFVGPSG